MLELLRRRPRLHRNGRVILPDFDGSISFERVHFRYPSRALPALVDVSLQVRGGEMLAFVGPSGAGKSTIFHLLEHFYEPSAGRVCLQGVAVRDLHHAWLHRTVRLVGQEPVLFSGSIHSNILYGLPGEAHGVGEADVAGGDSRRGQGQGRDEPEAEVRERVVAAAAIANAHDFVCGLPEGYQTGVGERGVQLSGG